GRLPAPPRQRGIPRGRRGRLPRPRRGRDCLRAVTPAPARRLVLLGATGSIGAQPLDVLARCPDIARGDWLAVGASRPRLVVERVLAGRPEQVGGAAPERAEGVSDAIDAACRAAGVPAPRLESGQAAVTELAGSLGPGDVVLNAITGSVG